jgi:hypothetical protein
MIGRIFTILLTIVLTAGTASGEPLTFSATG